MPLKKLTKDKSQMLLYIAMIVAQFVQYHLFLFPYPEFHNLVLPSNICWLILQILFFTASFMNPGRVNKNSELSFDKLVEKCDPNGLCPSCEVIFTKDSRHCFFCN